MEKIYACEDPAFNVNCFICVGKEICSNYRLTNSCLIKKNEPTLKDLVERAAALTQSHKERIGNVVVLPESHKNQIEDKIDKLSEK